MTLGTVGQPYAPTSAAAAPTANEADAQNATFDPVLRFPSDSADNVVANETVVIHQYEQMPNSNLSPADWERERIRTEFYATYDAMTGVRIASTLAGFFGLMVLLVMYKSRTNMLRALKNPHLAAKAADIVQEEEERELQDAFDTLEAAGIFPALETLPYRERRLLSLGNISAPPSLSLPRFSSVGGGSCSLWDPPMRASAPSRREAFGSSSGRSQCVSFDMSESTVRRQSRAALNRGWVGRRATFQSIQADALRSRNKVFLRDMRQDRESSRIKLIRLYTTSSEDVEEVLEDEAPAAAPTPPPPPSATNLTQRQNSTSSTSFILSSVDYQDLDLRSVGSIPLFSEGFSDSEEEEEVDLGPPQWSSEESDGAQVAPRVKSGAYQKMEQIRANTVQSNNSSVAVFGPPQSQASVRVHRKGPLESRTFRLHSSSSSTTGPTRALGLPSTTNKWSKETLF